MATTPRASSSSPMISASGAPLLSARRNCALRLPAPRLSSKRTRGRSLRKRSTSSSARSEQHTSELQSRLHLVCRLLLEKKKKKTESAHSAADGHTPHEPPTACAPPQPAALMRHD